MNPCRSAFFRLHHEAAAASMSRAVNLRESLTDFRRAGRGVSHSRKVVPDVSIIISAQHTHTHPPNPRDAGPVYTCSVCSTSTRDTARNSCDPDVFAEKTALSVATGGRRGDLEWETQTRANNSGPKATHSLRRTKFRADFSESGTALVWNAKQIRGRRE